MPMRKYDDEVNLTVMVEMDPGRRFRIAQRIHGKDDADIDRMVIAAKRQFTALLFAFVVAVCWGAVVSADTSSPLPSLLRHVFAWFVIPPLLASMASASFRHWQMSRRRFGTVAEWWREERANGCMPTGARRTALAALTAVVAASVVAHVADPSAWIGSPAAFGAASAPAFLMMNAALVAAGGATVAWHTLSRMADDAQDGRFLAARRGGPGAIIRVGTGAALLAPLSTGLCVVQVLVLHVVAVGGLLARHM